MAEKEQIQMNNILQLDGFHFTKVETFLYSLKMNYECFYEVLHTAIFSALLKVCIYWNSYAGEAILVCTADFLSDLDENIQGFR